MIIEYDGSKFIGWQIQKKDAQFKEKFKKNLKKFLKEKLH